VTLNFYSEKPGFGYRNRYFVQAVKCPQTSLIYVRTLKCASTFFYNNFRNVQSWPEINFNDIDWQHHRVFSHILHPYHRRAKGLAEYIHMHGLESKYWNDLDFQKFIHASLGLDLHSVTVDITYSHPACCEIHWLPVLSDHDQTINITNSWLSQHLLTLPRWDLSQAHLGRSHKREISDHIQQQPLDDHVLLYLDNDVQLYESVVAKYPKRSNPQCNSLKTSA
jgi:hypothetical protein